MKKTYLVTGFAFFTAFLFAQDYHALLFDGVDDYVIVTNDSLLTFGMESFSIVGWVNTYDGGTRWLTKDCLATQPGYFLSIQYGTARARISDGSSYLVCEGSIVNDGLWHHLAFTVDRSDQMMRLYVDGNQDDSLSITNIGSIYSEANILIGLTYNEAMIDSGYIDEVSMWKKRLYQSEIQQLMTTQPNINDPDLVAYWPMNEGMGQYIQDYSFYTHTGQLGSTSGPDPNDPQWVFVGFPENCTLFGDVNGDSLVNIVDVLTTADYILGFNPAPFNENCADCNDDNFINIIDIVRILNIIFGF
jgi:hypothetical protein